MERNLDRRVETLCRIADGEIATHLREVVLATYLNENARTYVLTPDGYRVTEGASAFDPQRALLEWYTTAPSPLDERSE
jgi:polyphosphate kinase